MTKTFFKILLAASLSVFGISGSAWAQDVSSALEFDASVHDFGTIREADGAVSHVFTFTNRSDKAIVIERVKADCGCTTPKYDREPIRPGETGEIEVFFDPENYPGRFRKNVMVYSGGGQNRYQLVITGYVIERERSAEERYPFTLAGGLRGSVTYLPFEYIQNNNTASMVVELFNSTENPVSVAAEVAPGSGRLTVDVPGTIMPGEKATATVTYDLTSGAPVYGQLSDRIYFVVDGVRGSLPVTANAIAIDDLGKASSGRAPVCEIKPSFHNFGGVKPGSVVKKEFRLRNAGKSKLVVRSVSSRRNVVCDLREGTELKPGQAVSFTVTFSPGDNVGTIIGGAMIITNDPERPVKDIRVAADVAE